MQLDDRWYELYTLLYGNTFNRILTLGNKKNGYINHNIRSLDQLQQEIDKHYPHKEFYISLYDYKTDTNLLKWDKIEKDKNIIDIMVIVPCTGNTVARNSRIKWNPNLHVYKKINKLRSG